MFYDEQIYERLTNNTEYWWCDKTIHSIIVGPDKNINAFKQYLIERFTEQDYEIVEITSDMSEEEAIIIMKNLFEKWSNRAKLFERRGVTFDDIPELYKKNNIKGIRILISGHFELLKNQIHTFLHLGQIANMHVIMFKEDFILPDTIKKDVEAFVILRDDAAAFKEPNCDKNFIIFDTMKMMTA